MKLSEVKSWGVDIGNVLIKNLPMKTQLLLTERKIPPQEVVKQLSLVPDALLGLRFLSQRVGPENVWIVSKASPHQREVSRLALEKFRFYPTTGLKPDQVLFCPERKDKRPIIKALDLEGHIDDRGEVIESIQKFVKCPVWFSPEEYDTAQWLYQVKYTVRVVSGWKQIMEMF